MEITPFFSFYAEGDNWQQQSSRNWSSRTVRLTLEYRFGKMEDKSRYSRQRNSQGMDMEEGAGEIF